MLYVKRLKKASVPSSLIQNPSPANLQSTRLALDNLWGGNEGPLSALIEGRQLNIWDLRMKEKGGCLQRICGSVGDILYAVSSSSTGTIAVGGADRTVTVYDLRRWSALSQWLNCAKYEITGLAFSSVDPDCIYVQGVDYEVLCGQWKDGRQQGFFTYQSI